MVRPQWISRRFNNLVQATLLLSGMGGVMVLLGWMLAGPVGVWYGLLLGVAMLFMPRASPQLILSMYQARKLSPEEAPGLYSVMEQLVQRTGLPTVPRMYYIPSSLQNAFTLGTRRRPLVAVTDGLLRGLPPNEVVAVLAHEMSHIRHNDMWIMSLADGVTRIIGTMAFVGQVLLLVNLPLVLIQGHGIPWVPILVLLAAPTVSALLQLSLSRNRELDADLEAARITGDPLALASALEKLEVAQQRIWERLFLPGRRMPDPSLLRSHPRTEQRVARLRELAAETRMGIKTPARWMGAEMDWGPVTERPRRRWHGMWY